jgi:hypothetical protein
MVSGLACSRLRHEEAETDKVSDESDSPREHVAGIHRFQQFAESTPSVHRDEQFHS